MARYTTHSCYGRTGKILGRCIVLVSVILIVKYAITQYKKEKYVSVHV
jgi:hypothetical protein